VGEGDSARWCVDTLFVRETRRERAARGETRSERDTSDRAIRAAPPHARARRARRPARPPHGSLVSSAFSRFGCVARCGERRTHWM
jgi:hypothetical protein